MKHFNNITLSVFTNPEDEREIRKLIVSLVPFDLKENKIELKRDVAEGFEGKKIIILSVVLKKDKHTNAFFDILINGLSKGNRELLSNQLNSRIDDACDFFMRLDKTALKQKTFLLTDSGNCIHVKINVAIFPKKKGGAVIMIKKLIQSMGA